MSNLQEEFERAAAAAKTLPERPGDDALWDMQQAGRTLLDAAGFERYEISAWAQQGRQEPGCG